MEEKPLSPHVLIFPLPAQGHVKPMLKLAELLSQADLKITFLNSEHNHKRLLRYTDIHARFAQYPGFQFKTFFDGLAEDHPRTGDRVREIFYAINLNASSFLKELLIDIKPPVTCVIGDGILRFITEVTMELKIPLVHFRTSSACSFWTYFCIREMIQAGELPLRDMDRLITTVPGMETFLRGRDLPSFCRIADVNDPFSQMVMTETRQSSGIEALLLNTFEDLEGPILSRIRTTCPKIYSVGPLHLHAKTIFTASDNMTSSPSSNNFWKADRTCIDWLDRQPFKSVIYASFGSVAVITKEQFMEIWYGLVNSKQRFLWVIRPDSVATGKGDSPAELVEETKERGYMVGWAPQEEVLVHKAVGGFLTHSGWNSTLESIAGGVPMLCWPCLADQQVNSRFVSEVWKIGLDMKDVCDRKIIEKMVNELMVERREEFVRSSDKMAILARKSVNEGGSSYCNLERLVNDIRLMSTQES